MRRFLRDWSLPPADAVRIEELINYFDYDYPDPEAGVPFGIVVEMADAPWAPTHQLVHIGLRSTPVATDDLPMLSALSSFKAGGSTAGGASIRLAYWLARGQFIEDRNNRVIPATDGHFNVGVSSDGELVELIERERESGVYLSVLGFGTGDRQDAKMERLAADGNGNYAYIDGVREARRVLVEQMGATCPACRDAGRRRCCQPTGSRLTATLGR